MKMSFDILRRDLRLSFRHGADAMAGFGFFILVLVIFGLGAQDRPEVLSALAPAILISGALLASLLTLESLYHRDAEDGTLDLYLFSRLRPVDIVINKMLAHFLLAGLPMSVLGGIGSILLQVPLASFAFICAVLVLQTVYLSLLGGLGAILTLGSRRPALLLVLIILPLLLPSIILGLAAMNAQLAGLPAKPYVLLHIALIIAALPLTMGAAASLLKLQQS